MPEPVLMDIRVELIEASNDVKALWAIEQVIKGLRLTPNEASMVLKYLSDKHGVPF